METTLREGNRKCRLLEERGTLGSKDNAAGNLYPGMKVNTSTLDLTIDKPTFNLAGIFTLNQTEPIKQILKQYEIFGMKVEGSPRKPLLGSDVTLSCTISRLSDTVSLHWRPMDSSQQNRSNTDQIRLDNTVYLIVQHVTVEDGKLYVCEVRENGKILHTSNGNVTVNNDLFDGEYTLYRSSTDHSELHLVCYSNGRNYSRAEWTWSPHRHQKQKVIASANRSQPIIINVNGTNFGNRLVTSGKRFDGKEFSVRIVSVVFQDAGLYICFLEHNLFVDIYLITVKVTAEPSDAVTEGDNVTLTCSVSNATDSMRLVWINGDGKRVGEKTLTVEEKSLSLVIQKAERGRGNWRCVLFDEDLPRLFVPYQEPRGSLDISSFTDIRIIIVLGYLVIKLAVAPGLICCS
ncbi:uncharacterized protein LOC129695223 [Leucoraja erinacea]|uniref:uncharacterized protein LOC129695223 n=1 Tax=Leucoraja erinaceus TaxID=7782 RepID=UPI002455E041|nr:uncharacterized protein LOC129695223 [Leucoraja erinacea]